MHPSKDKLKAFVDGTLDELSTNQISNHVESCEFCREFCEDYRLLNDLITKSKLEDIPADALKLADQLYAEAIETNIIPLSTLITNEIEGGADVLLAADGQGEPIQPIVNLATLYSEDPEVVLRIMRDSDLDKDYIQLISDDSSLISCVMVQIPELDKEYITDQNGFALIESGSSEEYSKHKWRIKFPTAVFDLEPLSYDPDRVEYTKEQILETDHQDKIKIIFMKKTEGKQISLQILELGGKTDFDNIRVVVSQQKQSDAREVKPNETVKFDIDNLDEAINIRLFHK